MQLHKHSYVKICALFLWITFSASIALYELFYISLYPYVTVCSSVYICVCTKYDRNERANVPHFDLCSVVKTKEKIPGYFFLFLIVNTSYKRWSSGFQAYRFNIYTIYLQALSVLTISLTLSYSRWKSIDLIFTFALLLRSSENRNQNFIEYSWWFSLF